MATSSDRTAGSTPAGQPALLVHGGAWDIPDAEVQAHLEGIDIAVSVGRKRLEAGESALDVAVATVSALESHPAFDAGRGAVLDRDGQPQLDAGIMDGATMQWGAVANVRHVLHPIAVARRLLEDDGQARLLVAEGAERFAAECGFMFVEPSAFLVEREMERFEKLSVQPDFHTSQVFGGGVPPSPAGTVGCVALDVDGRLAAATSTGGTPLARSGRVGDSPIVGAGFFADAVSAASATGWGEAIATVQLCASACSAVEAGQQPVDAASAALLRMRERIRWPGAAPASGGLICLSKDGVGGWAFTSPRMARGGWVAGGSPWVAIHPDR